MMRNKKSPGGDQGEGEMAGRAFKSSPSQSTTPQRFLQAPSGGAIGRMIDLSLQQVEYHTDRAAYHLAEAKRHAGEVAKHRAIRRSLEPLIPRNHFQGGSRP